MMGIFSMYTGLIYNDVFSKAFWFLGTSAFEYDPRGIVANGTKFNMTYSGTPYAFGVDPAWHFSDNALIFTNSYKMKMSVVMGVIHVRFF